MRQLVYYKMREKFIKKCVRFFITKCDSCYKLRQLYYKMRQLLQNVTFITNCDSTADINSRLQEIFMIIEKVLAGLSVMTVGDFLQLPPVLRKFISLPFSDNDSMKNLLGLKLWHLYKYAEFTEVVRQNVPIGIVADDVENYSKEDLYVTLMKTTFQKMPCICMQKTNQLLAEMKLFLIIYLVRFKV